MSARQLCQLKVSGLVITGLTIPRSDSPKPARVVEVEIGGQVFQWTTDQARAVGIALRSIATVTEHRIPAIVPVRDRHNGSNGKGRRVAAQDGVQ